MTTVTAVKRAAEEVAADPQSALALTYDDLVAVVRVSLSPTACTLLANRLSDRGDAGNAAARENLARLSALADDLTRDGRSDDVNALDWAIDQLTPPELARPANRIVARNTGEPKSQPIYMCIRCQDGRRACTCEPKR
jgi:hypothetical protein